MAQLRILPPAAKFLKKLKDKRLKTLYREAIDRILEDHTVGEAKTGDLAGVFGYDIYYNKTNYELAYTVEYVNDKIVVASGTRNSTAALYFSVPILPFFNPAAIACLASMPSLYISPASAAFCAFSQSW